MSGKACTLCFVQENREYIYCDSPMCSLRCQYATLALIHDCKSVHLYHREPNIIKATLMYVSALTHCEP